MNLATLMAVAAIAGMGAGTPAPAPPPRRQAAAPPQTRKHRDALQTEIAEHNAAVDRRKAEKKAAKLARRRRGY